MAESTRECISIDLRDQDFTSAYLAVICQGLVNRKLARPVAFCILRDSDYAWLQTMRDYMPDYTWREMNVEEMVAWVRQQPDIVQKQVLFDPNEGYAINNVTMLCAINNALPVTDDIGLETAFDCRHQWTDDLTATRWAFTELLDKCSHELLAIQSIDLYMQDFIVSGNLFSMRIDASQPGERRELFQNILEGGYFDDNVSVMGYHPSQEVIAKLTRKHSQISLVSDWCSNLSFYSQFPPVKQLKQPPKRIVDFNSNKTYICLISSDGDNMQLDINTLRVMFDLPIRGFFPISWTMSNRLMTFAPPVLDWFYKRANESGTDSFLMGPSGYGFLHPILNPNHEWFVHQTDLAAKTLDMQAYVHWDEYDRKDEMTKRIRSYSGTNIKGVFSPVQPNVDPYLDKVVTFSEWYRWFNESPVDVANQINNISPNGSLGYIFIILAGIGINSLREMVEHLKPHVEVVGYREMIDLAWQKKSISIVSSLESNPALRFQAASRYAVSEGFAGAIPTYEAQVYDGLLVMGVIRIRPEFAEFRDVPTSELRELIQGEDPSPPENRLRAMSRWAAKYGFAAAVPTFEEAIYDGVQVYGLFALKLGTTDWRDVPVSELQGGDLSKMGNRIQAGMRYAAKSNLGAALPTFEQATHNGVEVYGFTFIRPEVYSWTDVSALRLASML